MKMKKIKNKKLIFISYFNSEDAAANGFMQIFTEFRKNNQDCDYFQCIKAWKQKTKKNKMIVFYVPLFFLSFLPLQIARMLMRLDVNYFYDKDIVVDSDPYSLFTAILLKETYKNINIIYRQSDAIGYISGKTSYIKKIEDEVLSISDKIFLVNESQKCFLKKSLILKSFVVPNPVKVSKAQVKAISEKREKLFNEKKMGKRTFFYYGKLEIDKVLLSKLANTFPKDTFIIAGNYLAENQSPKNIIYTSFITQEKINKYLIEATALFLPYLIDGKMAPMLELTSKIVDSLSIGCPVYAIGVSDKIKQHGVKVARDKAEFIDFFKSTEFSIDKKDFSDLQVSQVAQKFKDFL